MPHRFACRNIVTHPFFELAKSSGDVRLLTGLELRAENDQQRSVRILCHAQRVRWPIDIDEHAVERSTPLRPKCHREVTPWLRAPIELDRTRDRQVGRHDDLLRIEMMTTELDSPLSCAFPFIDFRYA